MNCRLGSCEVASVLQLDRLGQLATLPGDRDVIDRLDPPVLIDEWQLDPPIWDAVRRSINAVSPTSPPVRDTVIDYERRSPRSQN